LDIGRLENVSIREVWQKEERDFTPWLANNIEILSEKLGIEISNAEREKRAGTFEVDLLAEDANSEPVIIECQFGTSDHDHLGKTLTYLTQLNAKVAVWICEKPREEHDKVVSWLNEATPVDFYLVKVEALRIGDSLPAPSFTVLSGPSIEARTAGEIKKDWAERHKKRFQFWKKLLEKTKSKGVSLFENIKPGRDHWLGTGAGKSGLSFNYLILKNSSRIELYIDTGNKEENKRFFDHLYAQKRDIEANSMPMSWQRLNEKRASRISVAVNQRFGLRNEEKWDKLQDDMIDTMVKFEQALREKILDLR